MFLTNIITCLFRLALILILTTSSKLAISQNISDIEKKIITIESEIKSLRENDKINNTIANHQKRLVDIEEEIRNLNGFFEELSFKLDELNNKIDAIKNTYVPDKNDKLSSLDQESQISNQIKNDEEETSIILEDPNLKNNPSMKVLGVIEEDGSEIENKNLSINEDRDEEIENKKKITLSEEELSKLAKNPSEIYKYAYNMLIEENFDEAESSFKTFIGEHPNDDLASNAYYWLGETYYVQKKFQLAAISFAKGYQRFPKGNKALDQLFKLALTFLNLGKNDDACASFSKLETEFPNAPKRISNRAKDYQKRAKCS